MTVRAKFKVVSITRQQGWSGVKEMQVIKLQPVTGNNPENAAFYAATPSGSIELGVVPVEVGNRFDIGAEFYVDFTPAE